MQIQHSTYDNTQSTNFRALSLIRLSKKAYPSILDAENAVTQKLRPVFGDRISTLADVEGLNIIRKECPSDRHAILVATNNDSDILNNFAKNLNMSFLSCAEKAKALSEQIRNLLNLDNRTYKVFDVKTVDDLDSFISPKLGTKSVAKQANDSSISVKVKNDMPVKSEEYPVGSFGWIMEHPEVSKILDEHCKKHGPDIDWPNFLGEYFPEYRSQYIAQHRGRL